METALAELEGTWDEINKMAPYFHGKRLHVTVREADQQQAIKPQAVDDALARIWRSVPDSSWELLPEDIGDDLDRHLYRITRPE